MALPMSISPSPTRSTRKNTSSRTAHYRVRHTYVPAELAIAIDWQSSLNPIRHFTMKTDLSAVTGNKAQVIFTAESVWYRDVVKMQEGKRVVVKEPKIVSITRYAKRDADGRWFINAGIDNVTAVENHQLRIVEVTHTPMLILIK